VLDEEIEGPITGNGIISDDRFENGLGGEGGGLALGESSSNCSDERRGELGMSSWMKSGFSEAATIDLSLGDPEAGRLWIRGVVRRCRKGTTDFQYLVPIPRIIRDATRSRIKVPAPTVVIMALMVNYRRKYSTNGQSSVEHLVVSRARTSIPSTPMDVTRDITRG